MRKATKGMSDAAASGDDRSAKAYRDLFNSYKELRLDALSAEREEAAKGNYGIEKIVIEFVYPKEEDVLRVRSIDEAIEEQVRAADGKDVSA